MKKFEISGVAKISCTKDISGDYARVEFNGIKIENLLADHMIEKDALDGENYIDETAICRVTISIEPYTEILSVNGKEMALEL